MKTYLQFQEWTAPGKRARNWVVYSVQTGMALGVVNWYGPRRCYVLTLSEGVVLEERHLSELVEFLRRVMAEHCLGRPEKAKKARF